MPRDRSRGQALVEVALVSPLFFALLFGLIDLGRVIWAIDSVGGAAREGARYASMHANTTLIPGTEVKSRDELKAYALGFVVAGGVSPTATVCFSPVTIGSKAAGCSGDTDTGTYARGNLVTVSVQSSVPIFLGAIFGSSTFPVSAESTVLINN
ncbi:MAG TPA: TadE/TadG family type IV pilus assembly protein [Candidatus Limnocylindrales bacterium]|nr:TadE/TadG family type IV pilus assembly protein [Candidatus Limnocylindrales bacterium]